MFLKIKFENCLFINLRYVLTRFLSATFKKTHLE